MENSTSSFACIRQPTPKGKAWTRRWPSNISRFRTVAGATDRVVWIGLGRVPDPVVDIPAIVAEFVSKRKRDRVRDYQEKRREYQAIGVREYWVIDRFDRTMVIFKNIPGEATETIVKAEETYRTALLPGFELPLARLLKVADDWAKVKSPRKKPASRKPTP